MFGGEYANPLRSSSAANQSGVSSSHLLPASSNNSCWITAPFLLMAVGYGIATCAVIGSAVIPSSSFAVSNVSSHQLLGISNNSAPL